MAKLVTKFKYIRPYSFKNVGGYVKYIATREGVEITDESTKLASATKKQAELIERILKDFPDGKEMLEYEDYLKNPTVGNASEFITRALEDNAFEVKESKTYADYIATRPRAERYGTHGLFTHKGVAVNLSEVSKELKEHKGNVWTAIISLRRDDAERLGYGTGDKWKELLRSQADNFSTNFNIPMSELKWYAAFHNESYHPHVHMIIYSIKRNDGFLTKNGVKNLRKSLANTIFKSDLYKIYEKKDEYRARLREDSKSLISEIISKINIGVYDNPELEEMLINLADRLSKTNGKKVYGYLKPNVKAIINNIVDELASDARIAKLYELWYEQNEEVYRTYSESIPKRIPLVDNKEFKSIKNAVISEAMHIVIGEHTVIGDDFDIEPKEPESDEIDLGLFDDEFERLRIQATKGNKWAQYGLAKMMLDKESEHYDPDVAVEWLNESARQNYTAAKYKLGKMFLYGEDVPRDTEYALRWLKEAVTDGNHYAEFQLGRIYVCGKEVDKDYDKGMEYLKSSAEKGNQYAEQLIHSIENNRNWYAGVGIINLFYHLSRILREKTENDNAQHGRIDRKIRRKIDEKKQAQGLRI